MNTSIIHLSLKYLNNNYTLISKLSIWINEYLVIIHYDDYKLKKAFKLEDSEVIKSIICLTQDQELLTYNFYIYVSLMGYIKRLNIYDKQKFDNCHNIIKLIGRNGIKIGNEVFKML